MARMTEQERKEYEEQIKEFHVVDCAPGKSSDGDSMEDTV